MRNWVFLTLLTGLLFLGASPASGEKKAKGYDLTTQKIQVICLSCRKSGYAVVLSLKEPYRTQFADLTEALVGQKLSVEHDGKVYIHTTVHGRIAGGTIVIGDFSELEDAKGLIRKLRPGITEEEIEPCDPRFWPCGEPLKFPQHRFILGPETAECACYQRMSGKTWVTFFLRAPYQNPYFIQRKRPQDWDDGDKPVDGPGHMSFKAQSVEAARDYVREVLPDLPKSAINHCGQVLWPCAGY